jgi:hypothetical protein
VNSGLTWLQTIISFIYASLFVLVVLLSFNGDAHGSAIVAGVILLPIALLHWCAARGAERGQRWGRITSMVIAVLKIFGFPIGTIIAICVFFQTGQRWQAAELQRGRAEMAAG